MLLRLARHSVSILEFGERRRNLDHLNAFLPSFRWRRPIAAATAENVHHLITVGFYPEGSTVYQGDREKHFSTNRNVRCVCVRAMETWAASGRSQAGRVGYNTMTVRDDIKALRGYDHGHLYSMFRLDRNALKYICVIVRVRVIEGRLLGRTLKGIGHTVLT